MKKYNYFLFDWDGTLAKTLDVWFESLKKSLMNNGHILRDEDIGANYDRFKNNFELNGQNNADSIIDEASQLSMTRMVDVNLYEGARELLEFLNSRGKHIGLVTTSTHTQIDALLNKNVLKDLFEVVICGDDVSNIKPDAEPILAAMSSLNANPNDIVMIGDSASDIKAASNASIDSVLYYPTSHSKYYNINELRLLEPTYIVSELVQIKTFM